MFGILWAEMIELFGYGWEVCRVCLRGALLGVLGPKSMASMFRSLLLSDWTRGLVGCL